MSANQLASDPYRTFRHPALGGIEIAVRVGDKAEQTRVAFRSTGSDFSIVLD